MDVEEGNLNALACATCAAHALKICQAASLMLPAYEPTSEVKQSGHNEEARRIALHAYNLKDDVAFLCNGWASRCTSVPNGRQLLSILLPGDIMSAHSILGPPDGWFIDCITNITYRCFHRHEILETASRRLKARAIILEVVAQEIQRADDFIIHLGRGSAEQRISYLLTSIITRLQKKRGLAPQDVATVAFPLRQQHIADAAGLTSVHVSNILSDFRRRHLIELTDRTLTVLDWNGLARLSALHAA
jgi:CRP/FNR family transcriptional regulator, anaerobic regulatory protein